MLLKVLDLVKKMQMPRPLLAADQKSKDDEAADENDGGGVCYDDDEQQEKEPKARKQCAKKKKKLRDSAAAKIPCGETKLKKKNKKNKKNVKKQPQKQTATLEKYAAGDFQQKYKEFLVECKAGGMNHAAAIAAWKKSPDRASLLAKLSDAERKRRRFD